jgi:queuosine precursor transporter
MRAYRYLDVASVFFVVILLVSNVAAVKALRLSGWLHLDIDGGTLLFPLSYIFGDILVEVYGYARSRRVIWLGFASNAMAALVFSLVVALPPSPDWRLQDAFAAVLGQTPRIVIASLIAFWFGEFSNSYVMAKMKVLTRGRWLWTRTIGSTLVGEGLDSLLFQVIAFGGVWPLALVLRVSLWNYILKVGYEVLATPITYRVVAWLKRAEQEDHFDRDTRFNPFSLSV